MPFVWSKKLTKSQAQPLDVEQIIQEVKIPEEVAEVISQAIEILQPIIEKETREEDVNSSCGGKR